MDAHSKYIADFRNEVSVVIEQQLAELSSADLVPFRRSARDKKEAEPASTLDRPYKLQGQDEFLAFYQDVLDQMPVSKNEWMF